MRLFKRFTVSLTAMAMAIGSVAVGSASEVRAAAPIVQGSLIAINNHISIIFSAWLGTPLPTASQFELKVDGATVPVTSLTPVGSILEVNFAPNVIFQGMTVTISYLAPAVDNTTANAAIQDSAGRDGPSFTNLTVENMQPPQRPTTTTTLPPSAIDALAASWNSDPATEAETDSNTVGYMPLSAGNIVITDQVGFVLDARNGIKPKIRMKNYAGIIKMKIAGKYKVAGKTKTFTCTFAPFGTNKKSKKVAWKWYTPRKACVLPAPLVESVRNGYSTLTATATWPRMWLATGKTVRPNGTKIQARKLRYTIRNRP